MWQKKGESLMGQGEAGLLMQSRCVVERSFLFWPVSAGNNQWASS
jgi:hypothetical protein